MQDLKDLMQPTFDEIERRRISSQTCNTVPGKVNHFPPSAHRGASDALESQLSKEQKWALVSFGTNVLAPRPEDPTRPSLRIYGAFLSKEEAREHAPIVQALDPTCSLLAVEMRQWILLPQTEECRDDPQVNEAHLSKRLQEHAAERERDERDFEDMRREKRAGTLSASVKRAADAADAVDEEEQDALTSVYPPPKRLNRNGAEVRGQSFACITLIQDETGGECAIQVLGCFQSLEEANAWAQDVGSRSCTDTDILVAPTCEWLYPNSQTHASTPHNYRISEQQIIMDAKVKNDADVCDFKEWKRQQKEHERKKALQEPTPDSEGPQESEPESMEVEAVQPTSSGNLEEVD